MFQLQAAQRTTRAPFVLAIAGATESTLVKRINPIGKSAFLPITRRAMRLGDTGPSHVLADADIHYVHGTDADEMKKGVSYHLVTRNDSRRLKFHVLVIIYGGYHLYLFFFLPLFSFPPFFLNKRNR